MTAGRPVRSRDRLERIARTMLGVVLLAAVAWALTGNNTALLSGGF
jgi:hypothetical protein